MEYNFTLADVSINEIKEKFIKKELWTEIFVDECNELNLDPLQWESIDEIPESLKIRIDNLVEERYLKAEIIIKL